MEKRSAIKCRCGKLLFIALGSVKNVEIKCRSCKKTSIIDYSPPDESPPAVKKKGAKPK